MVNFSQFSIYNFQHLIKIKPLIEPVENEIIGKGRG